MTALSNQWLTITTTDDPYGGTVPDDMLGGTTSRIPPGQAETQDGVIGRLRAAGQEFTQGPDWIEFATDHYTESSGSWTSRTRLVWSDRSAVTS